MRRRLEIHHAACTTGGPLGCTGLQFRHWLALRRRMAVLCARMCVWVRARGRILACSGGLRYAHARMHMHVRARIRKRFGNTAGVKPVTSLLANIALSIAHAHARARLRLRDTLNKPWWGVKGGHQTKMINRYKNTDIEEIALARASEHARARAPVSSRVDWSSDSLSVGVFIERDGTKGANISLHSLRGKSVSPI